MQSKDSTVLKRITQNASTPPNIPKTILGFDVSKDNLHSLLFSAALGQLLRFTKYDMVFFLPLVWWLYLSLPFICVYGVKEKEPSDLSGFLVCFVLLFQFFLQSFSCDA